MAYGYFPNQGAGWPSGVSPWGPYTGYGGYTPMWWGPGPMTGGGWAPPWMTWGGTWAAPGVFGGLGGLRRRGGEFSPQFVATGLPTDEEIEEMIYDTLDVDPLVPSDADINVDVSSGVVVLTGTVPNKAAKHAAGDDAWWAPGVVDVNNNLSVSGRRRIRGAPPGGPGAGPTRQRPRRGG